MRAVGVTFARVREIEMGVPSGNSSRGKRGALEWFRSLGHDVDERQVEESDFGRPVWHCCLCGSEVTLGGLGKPCRPAEQAGAREKRAENARVGVPCGGDLQEHVRETRLRS